jgi:hypothetical protein
MESQRRSPRRRTVHTSCMISCSVHGPSRISSLTVTMLTLLASTLDSSFSDGHREGELLWLLPPAPTCYPVGSSHLRRRCARRTLRRSCHLRRSPTTDCRLACALAGLRCNAAGPRLCPQQGGPASARLGRDGAARCHRRLRPRALLQRRRNIVADARRLGAPPAAAPARIRPSRSRPRSSCGASPSRTPAAAAGVPTALFHGEWTRTVPLEPRQQLGCPFSLSVLIFPCHVQMPNWYMCISMSIPIS